VKTGTSQFTFRMPSPADVVGVRRFVSGAACGGPMELLFVPWGDKD
jgi:hypothetical protein